MGRILQFSVFSFLSCVNLAMSFKVDDDVDRGEKCITIRLLLRSKGSVCA